MGEQADDRKPTLATRTAGVESAWTVSSLLLSGLLVWGGIGWLVDRWLGTNAFLPAGLILGCFGGMYLVIKRFGTVTENSTTTTDGKDE